MFIPKQFLHFPKLNSNAAELLMNRTYTMIKISDVGHSDVSWTIYVFSLQASSSHELFYPSMGLIMYLFKFI